MLEDQVAYLLQRYLGNYVRGLNKEALKISVWRGDVELKNMQLKPEALNALKLPVKVKAGFLGSVRLKVPWSRLGQDPVLVYLDRIFLLAEPATEVEGSTEDALQEAKKNRIREMEMKLLERAQQLKLEVNKSWLGSLINTIIGNLKLSISNIHIRYEDLESHPGHPFSAGVMLGKLSAVTVDDNGRETFVTGSSLECIQKSAELDQLALYLDSDITPWHLDQPWEDLPPSDWVQVFRYGTVGGKPADHLIEKHSYVLQPVSGNGKYSKLQGIQSSTGDQPRQKAIINLDDVTLCFSKDGYRDVLKLADNFASFNQRLKYAHYRPLVPVKSSPRSWWKYACRAVSDQIKKASGKLSWEQVLRYTRLRKRYISLYASLLKSDLNRLIVDDNKEIEEMDKELDIDLIIQWRMLAHKFVEKSVESDAYLMRQKAKKPWWSFGWNDQSPRDESGQFNFTDEDWEQLNRIIGYKEGADSQSIIGVQRPDALQTFLEIHMRRNATKLGGDAQECLAELSCNDLDCSVKLYPETKVFDLKLGSYRLSSPNGLLAESATSLHSLSGIFCYKPFDVKVDWSLVVKASPCYMTYLKDSIDEIIKFFQTNDAVSQAIALETAAALQTTIDEVKRTAQKQVNRALKDHLRFYLDLDIAAPKVKIPTPFCPDNVNATNLLLDFGNLMIRSQDDYGRKSSEEQDMYLQFDLVLSDVSAFLVDGDYNWSEAAVDRPSFSKHLNYACLLPVVDKCGVILRLQQIRLENPSYPSTRLSVRVPSLGFHFSPARYHRLMHVVEIFQEDTQKSDLLRPWDQADFEGWLFLLVRKGMGNREAVWQRRYICLVGPFFYVLEHPGSKSYKQCISLRGKQVQTLPVEFVGGVPHVLAICEAAYPINKVVEDVNSLILRCDSDDAQISWQKRLQAAIYLASSSAAITTLSESSSDHEDSETEVDSFHASKILSKERVFLTGVLDELKIRFNYSHNDQGLRTVLLAAESRLFEFRAIGGQVELSLRGKDLLIGTVLKSLEIEDLVSCNSSSQACFLARSVIRTADTQSSLDHDDGSQTFDSNEGDDKFYEASENLVDSDLSFQFENSSYKPPNFSRVAGLLPGDSFQKSMKDNEVTESLDSFIKAQIVIYDQNSPLYDNVDMQVMVTLATLSFFCRRPTIVAVMDFVNSINPGDKSSGPGDSPSLPMVGTEAVGDDVVRDIEEPAVKGLLGKGKSRVIFDLILKMARAQISLMNENGSKLATLSQDNLFTNIKVFPSSFSINAALGNLRISDDNLHEKHAYFWMCDMRNPGGSSFVELLFTSFSADDDDYEGYEYSLFGQLSEVRIVYLNRFVQEVTSYFMGLVPNNSSSVVKLKDQNTNAEKWFTTSEIEGSPALKLDISLRKPIILMPRRTDSPDYLKLDVVHITVRNTFQWLSGSKDDIHAVHMDILMIQVEDINLNVGTGTELSESIIQDVKGLSLVIRRSLRDLLHQVPNVEAAIKIEKLKAALSNREYQIVTECATSNISETPRVVPSLKHVSQTISSDAIEPVSTHDPGNVSTQSQNQEVWISVEVSVMVNLVELSLHAGLARDTSLATMQIMGLWLLYKSDNQMESFLSATLKGFTVIDDREGTADEFRLAIGMLHDIGNCSLVVNENHQESKTNFIKETDTKPVPTMLILDAKLGRHSTAVSLCVQRPQMLVALDFLLAVVEFFVPAIGGILSNEENKNPIDILDAIVLDQPVYRQPTVEVSLTPLRPLVVDHESFDQFIYDGNGGTVYLRDRRGFQLSSSSKEPVIYVGHGKKLQFKNVVIKDGQYLDSCVWLGSNSGYSASRDDQVLLETEDKAPHLASCQKDDNDRPSEEIAGRRTAEFVLEFQAIGPELTFYNTSKDVGLSPILSNRLLHAQLDAFSRFVLKGDAMEATANVLGFMMESNGIKILEPFDSSLKFSSAYGRTNIHVSVSDIFMNCTFSILRLFLAVEEDILTFLQRTSQKITVTCSQFDKVGTIRNLGSDQVYAFWRPRAPPGFAVLGDYLTPMDKPPTKGVVAVNTNLVRVKRPVSYKLIWPQSASYQSATDSYSDGISTLGDDSCSIWFPEAPKGYVAMGCVVAPGRKEPSSSSTFCIWSPLVSPCSLRDCVNIDSVYPSSLAFWRVDNSIGSFLPAEPSTLSPAARAYELRHIKFGLPEPSFETSNLSDDLSSSTGHVDPEKAIAVNSGRRFEAVASFQLIWWNRGTNSRKKLSIWRPVVPQGMVYFGDVAVKGYEPPSTCVVLNDSGDGELFKAPLDYQLVGQIKKQRGAESISFWMPQPPPGFVSLGCVASKGSPKQSDLSKLRCMRSDMVTGDQFVEESVWDTSDAKFGSEPLSLWTVDNELGTFLVRGGFKKPPRRFALKLADPSAPGGSETTIVDAEIGTFSMAIFDDYGGLMVPLFNLSLSGVVFSLRGRADYLASTVSFSLTARSFNDKYDAWEPLIEPVDGFLRYQYNINSPGSPSQLRLTTTGNLNLNVSVSNSNMIIQAYASWSSLTDVHASYRKGDAVLSTVGASPIIDVHHRANFYIIPTNKLGQDIFIRATETRGLSDIIRMPSGDMKPVKVPVLKNMLDSHSKEKICAENRKMVTVVIADAQFPKVVGLASNMYTLAIRLVPTESMGTQSLIRQQSARTSGTISTSSASEYEFVNWSEIFFFKVDSQDNYSLELLVTNMGKGEPVGFFTSHLKEVASNVQGSACQYDYQKHLTWIDLRAAKSTDVSQADEHDGSYGRLRLAVLFSPGPEVEEPREFCSDGKQSGFIQISPSVEGPWTTVRLNYAAPAACWRLGNDVVASEVIMKDGNRFLNIRSLVSVHNNTDFLLDLRLVPKSFNQVVRSLDDVNKREGCGADGRGVQTEEFFETERHDPTLGWINCSNNLENGGRPKAMSGVVLPLGWDWLDDWHLDTSSVNTTDGWVYAPNVESLKWPESFDPQKSVNCVRQRRWIRNRKLIPEMPDQDIHVGSLEPGETLPLPLPGLTQEELYVLQMRPLNCGTQDGYSWSSLVERLAQPEGYGKQRGSSGLNVSSLSESDELLYCEETSGTSSSTPHKLWFCATVQTAEIAKDIHSNPIQDWSIVIKSPLCISNYLPLSAEYSIYDIQATGHSVACARGIFHPGETIKIHAADIRNLLLLSMLPQRGWLPIDEAVLISHPSGLPSKTASLRSSISGRIVQLILEQNYERERPLMPRAIRVYAPYWFSVARCPPLTCRIVDISGKREGKKISLPFHSKRTDEAVLGEITAEEFYEGHTIASALNFKQLALSVSITESAQEPHFGPPKDLSPLGDMDGSLDLYACDADGNCMQLFTSTKPCPYQSVPTKVISVRPFLTFTNRLGQDIFIKLNGEDQPKVLRASDARVSFMHREAAETNKIQVQLEDTEWSYPVQITKEDTIFLILRAPSGNCRILRTEVRGFEEGSRFIVVFRLGPTDGPFRIENRTMDFTIRLRQAGFGEDAWVTLAPLSTINFSWEDPYGQKFIDAQINNDHGTCAWKLELERTGVFTVGEAEIRFQFHVVQIGHFKVVRFSDYRGLDLAGESGYLTYTGNGGNSALQKEVSRTAMELIVEFGVVGISVVDHRPKELLYLYLERVFLSYSTGYDGGTTSRLKLLFGYIQLDNQLPLTLMPVLLAPEPTVDAQHPVFKMTITARNENADGTQVYPYIYIRVSEKVWRIDIHEPIIWALASFFNYLQLDRFPDSSNVTEVDPEIRLELIDISEIRLKLSLETAPAERPQGVLGIWSPVLSALGNAFKIQVHLRRVMQRDRFMRKSSIVPAIRNRIWRDLIHNPLHLLFSVDILGMTSSTLASLSKGFAELSTDGQFLQLRSKQVGSRRITGVSEGIIQGTEALAQGFAFGVSGVVTKPVESAREHGLLGLAHGLGRAFLGFIVQPVSGALDFFSLTVDGIGASCSKCLEVLNNKVSSQRIRCPRAIHADCILREYSEKEAVGQVLVHCLICMGDSNVAIQPFELLKRIAYPPSYKMILYLGEASRRFGCTEIFKEPSKFAWSDYYEAHFTVPYQRIVLVTNKRVMLLQCRSPDKMAKKPSKIMWDVPWEELMALELAKAGCRQPSHLLLHLKSFRRSESFVRVIKCHVEEPDETEPQAVRICAAVRRMWKDYYSNMKSIVLKVPSSQRRVHFAWSDSVRNESRIPGKAIIKSRGSLSTTSNGERFVKHSIDFLKIWSSEQEPKGRCRLCRKQVQEDGGLCSIWRPICPDGYVSIGDVAHVGSHLPNVAAVYRNSDRLFAVPVGYDLVWRNCPDDYRTPLSIWHPRAPDGFVAPGCVAVAGFEEPQVNLVFCVAESLVEQTEFEEQKIWSAPDSYPWACHIYQVKSDALHFVALRQTKEESEWKPTRVVDDPNPQLLSLEAQ